MSKVIQFPSDRLQNPHVQQLLEISNQIDEIIINAVVDQDMKPRDIAGILAHRLGALMRNADEKDKLWGVCEKVAKKQAAID